MANTGSQKKTKKRIMHSFVMNEISGVDNPAQPDARVTLMKRAAPDGDHSDPAQEEAQDGEQFGKQAALTSADKGHTHLIRLDNHQGLPLSEGETSYQAGHSHPWIIDQDGTLIVGEVNGHTHDIQALGKLSEEGSLVPSEDEQDAGTSVTKSQEDESTMADENNKELEAVQAQLAKSQAIIGLTTEHRAHFDTLDDAGKDAFLAKSVDARQSEIDALADANAVVYKSLDGLEFTKSDDPRLITMAKQADADRKALQAERTARREDDLRKRAETDLANLPGDLDSRVALLKAAESIEDETARKTAVDALKAQSIELGKAASTLGYQGQGGQTVISKSAGEQSADAELVTMAKAYAKEHNVPEAAAYDAVIQTPKGAELYAQTLN